MPAKEPWLFVNDEIRPDKPHDENDLIRIYPRDPEIGFQVKPDEMTLDDLGMQGKRPLWTPVWTDTYVDPDGEGLDSYFVVIKRETVEKIQWDKTPYLKVDQPWDPPDERKHLDEAFEKAEASFIDMAIKSCSREEKPIWHCLCYQVSEYKKKAKNPEYGMETFNGAMEALKPKAEQGSK
ncbi:MAG: hypothetical protein Q9213_008225 [Squamulea squamosa]